MVDSAPTEVDLFSNILDVSFSDADSMVPTQVRLQFLPNSPRVSL